MAKQAPSELEISLLSVDELRKESQTDQSSNHAVGYAWARAAEAKLKQNSSWTDPVLHAQILAQVTIRGVLAGIEPEETDKQLEEAYRLLVPGSKDQSRARLLLAIAGLRVAGVRCALHQSAEQAGVERAMQRFEEAMAELGVSTNSWQEAPLGSADRLLTMGFRHAATLEGLDGKIGRARTLGKLALHYAEIAAPEDASEEDHAQFVSVQTAKAHRLLEWLAQPRVTETWEQDHQLYLTALELVGNPSLVRKPSRTSN